LVSVRSEFSFKIQNIWAILLEKVSYPNNITETTLSAHQTIFQFSRRKDVSNELSDETTLESDTGKQMSFDSPNEGFCIYEDLTRAAEALHLAVAKLREEPNISFKRWVPFVHYGL
jgi:hypothetical protein